MTLNRREFLKAAALSGAGALLMAPPNLRALASTGTLDTTGSTGGIERPVILPDARKLDSRLGIDSCIWNWRSDADPNGARPANYYEASLSDWPCFASLPGDLTCDVVVIGGGLLGASTALHLAEAGVDVILVEKDNLGSAASGRNGGQMTPGLARWKAASVAGSLPLDEAKRLWRFVSVEAMELVDEITARYGLDCDRKRGHVTAAVLSAHMGALVADADARRALGDGNVSIVGPNQLQEYVRSDTYRGGAIDSIGGQLHPLALLRGLAFGLVERGGRVYEGTEVMSVKEAADTTVVTTPFGRINARRAVVLAVHASTFRFIPGSSTTLPFFTYVGVTAPLQTDLRDLMPAGLPVYDTQLQIDYYRAVRNNRLLFGGEGTGGSWSVREVNRYLGGRIGKVFPQLANPELEYAWGGVCDMTLHGATDCRRSGGKVPVYMVHGWSGHGVAQTVRIGKAISDDVTGRNDDFIMLTRVDHAELPLARHLAPVAIPLMKSALGVMSVLKPGDLISF